MNDYMYMNKDVSEPEVESQGDSDGEISMCLETAVTEIT